MALPQAILYNLLNMAGVTLSDRKLGAEVRKLVLSKAKAILEATYEKGSDEEKFQRTVLEKLLTTALPRINEHTGQDGEPINFNIINYGQIGNPVPLQTTRLPNGTSASSPEVQDSSTSSPSGQI